MAFEVGKRVVAESESPSRRPRCGVVEEVLRGEPSPPVSHPLGRRPREHLHARERSPPSRTAPEKTTTIDAAETLTRARPCRGPRGRARAAPARPGTKALHRMPVCRLRGDGAVSPAPGTARRRAEVPASPMTSATHPSLRESRSRCCRSASHPGEPVWANSQARTDGPGAGATSGAFLFCERRACPPRPGPALLSM